MRSCLDAVMDDPCSAAKTAPALPPDKPAPEAQAGARRARNGTSGAVGLLLFVHLNSERTVEPVRQDGSFAEKQQSYRAHLFLVPSDCLRGAFRDAPIRSKSGSGLP